MSKKIKKIYLSAPISGYDIPERQQTFQDMETKLSKLGYQILNPMKNGLDVSAPTSQHMKRDIIMLLQADAIFLMQNWNKSAGCLTELHVATACDLDVLFEGISEVQL